MNYLKMLTIGTCSYQCDDCGPIFGKVQALSFKNLPVLNSLVFGNNSFPQCEELTIEGDGL